MSYKPPKDFIEQGVRLTILLLLLYWCLYILGPFILLILWAIIIAVTLYPVLRRIVDRFGWNQKFVSVLLVLALLAVFVVPISLVAQSVISEIDHFWIFKSSGQLEIPMPPDTIQEWPLIGEELYFLWIEAHEDLTAFVKHYKTPIGQAGAWVGQKLAGLGLGLLQIIVSIIIGGILMANNSTAENNISRIFDLLFEDKGKHMLNVAVSTIRNVAKGILGIAFFQAMLMGIGMYLAGMPGAGLLTLLALFCGIIQIGTAPVTIIVLLWAWPNMSGFPATVITVYMIVVGLIDNFLKPLVLGKGKEMPMIVVFLGALGGFIAYGLIGLFVGAVVLVIAWQVIRVWIEEKVEEQHDNALELESKED